MDEGWTALWLDSALQPSFSQNWLLLSVRTQELLYLLDEGAPSPKYPKTDAERRIQKSRQPNKFSQPCNWSLSVTLEENPPQGRALALKPNYFHETNMEMD